MRSASQVSTAERCWRRWSYSYRDRLPRKERPSLELGNAVHDIAERWLKDGTPVDTSTEAGAIFAAGVHLLPDPPQGDVEQWFAFRVGGEDFIGKKDLVREGEVWDHKTTSDLKRATSKDLRTDTQAGLYAAHELWRQKRDDVELRWVYYRTRKPYKAERVHLRVTRDDVRPTLERAVRVAQTMTQIEELGVRTADLPANATACADFGGCDFKDVCPVPPEQAFAAAMATEEEREQMTMNHAKDVEEYLTRMKARGGAGVAINPPEGSIALPATDASGGSPVARKPPPPPRRPVPPVVEKTLDAVATVVPEVTDYDRGWNAALDAVTKLAAGVRR